MSDSITIASDQQQSIPLWLLAELSYSCPLQCAYCSNPINYPEARSSELSTDEWKTVFKDARKMGAVQLGLSGGEPLVRPDLEELIAEARALGFYTNLITSAVGADAARLAAIREAGLDHIQISFQGSNQAVNDHFAGTKSFHHKVMMAKEAKKLGFPMVLNFVLHRQNIHQIADMLKLAEDLNADFVELANSQYYGWALKNIDALLPSRQQLVNAEAITNDFRKNHQGNMDVIFVVPDEYENRPKACCNGWGTTFVTVTPDGNVQPCQSAQVLPGFELPNVRRQSLEWAWRESPLFNAFRGTEWMQEPCRSCPEKEQDLGGCRCQAYLLTGDAYATDPVCDLSPKHSDIERVVASAQNIADLNDDGFSYDINKADDITQPLLFRNPKNAKILTKK